MQYVALAIIFAWVLVLWLFGLVFHLPPWLAVTTVHLTELVAGLFLGFVGLVLAGDFRAWCRQQQVPMNPTLAGLVLLAMYALALAIIRYV